jgi:hypothetical protein
MAYCPIDVKCCDCKKRFEVDKGSVEADTPIKMLCPNCGSQNTRRVYGCQGHSVGAGKCGNASTGYGSAITYHPNSLAPNLRGKKIKK